MKTQVKHKVMAIDTHDMGNEEYCVPRLESWSVVDFPEVFDACADFMPEESGNEFSVYSSW